MPKISIIVPIYNADIYLRRCLDCILAQTFNDFELLLIDDGSTDKSGQICDEYAAKDSRIRVFHKTNGGVSSARNVGLKNALGEWITFCDADDWLKNNWLGIYLTEMANSHLIVQGIDMVNPRNGEMNHIGISFFGSTQNGIIEMNNPPQIGYTVNKLFNHNILKSHNILFNEDYYIREDLDFVLEYCSHISSIKCHPESGYVYVLPDNGKSYRGQNTFECNCSILSKLNHIYDYNENAVTKRFANDLVKDYFGQDFDIFNDVYTKTKKMLGIIHRHIDILEISSYSKFFLKHFRSPFIVTIIFSIKKKIQGLIL